MSNFTLMPSSFVQIVVFVSSFIGLSLALRLLTARLEDSPALVFMVKACGYLLCFLMALGIASYI